MKKNNSNNRELLLEEGDPFADLPQDFQQIDRIIPIEEQKRYYISSHLNRKRQLSLSPKKLASIEGLLYDKRMGENWHRNTLVQLAAVRQLDAYRILEDFLIVAPERLKNWATLAEFDARIAIEADLTDRENVTVVTSGLGGRKNKMRFSSVCITTDWGALQAYQKDLLEKELLYAIKRANGELEDLHIGDSFVIANYLIPIGINPEPILRGAFAICNEMGDFMDISTLRTTNISLIEVSDIDHLRRMMEQDKDKEETKNKLPET